MTGAPERDAVPATVRGSQNLLLRIATGFVLAPGAIAAAYVGEWLWVGLTTFAAIGMFVEWLVIVGSSHRKRVAAVGVGSFVTKAAAGTQDYHLVTKAAETFLAAVQSARS